MFVTSTSIHTYENKDICCTKENGEFVKYSVTTNPFNKIMLTMLKGIEVNIEE